MRSGHLPPRVLLTALGMALLAACADSPTQPTAPAPPLRSLSPSSLTGGPIVLMGIDPEGGGPCAPGPLTAYRTIVTSILANVTNGGTGIVVIGGGKVPPGELLPGIPIGGDEVTVFWNALVDGTGIPLTFVNGFDVGTISLDGFGLVVVPSSEFEVNGGISNGENALLVIRRADLTAFVNGGGGLLGFTARGLLHPYGYLADMGSFTFSFVNYKNITPTAEGLELGITDDLDLPGLAAAGPWWHDEYLAFPPFMSVLATNAATGAAAAIGGRQVLVGPPPPPLATEACSPGFWSQNGGRLAAWPSGFASDDAVRSVFVSAAGYLGDASLLQALQGYRSDPPRRSTVDGAREILLRQAVAAVLNEATFGAAYPAGSVAELQSAVNAALEGAGRDAVLMLADALNAWNSNLTVDPEPVVTGGCPL